MLLPISPIDFPGVVSHLFFCHSLSSVGSTHWSYFHTSPVLRWGITYGRNEKILHRKLGTLLRKGFWWTRVEDLTPLLHSITSLFLHFFLVSLRLHSQPFSQETESSWTEVREGFRTEGRTRNKVLCGLSDFLRKYDFDRVRPKTRTTDNQLKPPDGSQQPP